jgi:hypothetical protein
LKITGILEQNVNIYTVDGKEGKLDVDESKLLKGIYFISLPH